MIEHFESDRLAAAAPKMNPVEHQVQLGLERFLAGIGRPFLAVGGLQLSAASAPETAHKEGWQSPLRGEDDVAAVSHRPDGWGGKLVFFRAHGSAAVLAQDDVAVDKSGREGCEQAVCVWIEVRWHMRRMRFERFLLLGIRLPEISDVFLVICAVLASETTEAKADLGSELMRPRILTPWVVSKKVLMESFGLSKEAVDSYDAVSKEDQLKAYDMMQLCRQFETACNQVISCKSPPMKPPR